MIPDIKNKLEAKLGKAHLEESDITYILIEIGRLIELTNVKSKYETLWFYRNWVAHSQIDRQSSFIKELKNKLGKINFQNG